MKNLPSEGRANYLQQIFKLLAFHDLGGLSKVFLRLYASPWICRMTLKCPFPN